MYIIPMLSKRARIHVHTSWMVALTTNKAVLTKIRAEFGVARTAAVTYTSISQHMAVPDQ